MLGEAVDDGFLADGWGRTLLKELASGSRAGPGRARRWGRCVLITAASARFRPAGHVSAGGGIVLARLPPEAAGEAQGVHTPLR